MLLLLCNPRVISRVQHRSCHQVVGRRPHRACHKADCLWRRPLFGVRPGSLRVRGRLKEMLNKKGDSARGLGLGDGGRALARRRAMRACRPRSLAISSSLS